LAALFFGFGKLFWSCSKTTGSIVMVNMFGLFLVFIGLAN
jgi:hypothetical protein